ncbi:MAG: hypothetical protein HY674_17895 [Chloroflexi bacterium]|nr:hypothetical protein [Chloroflexota bacterium]
MKSGRPLAFAVIAVVLFGTALAVLAASKRAKPPGPDHVVGTWLGFSAAQVEFVRADFDADGTGYVAVSYLRDFPVRLYRIDSWRLIDWSIEATTHPIDQDAEPIVLRKLSYSDSALEMDLRGKGWRHDVTLFREREFALRAAAVGARIESHRNEQR